MVTRVMPRIIYALGLATKKGQTPVVPACSKKPVAHLNELQCSPQSLTQLDFMLLTEQLTNAMYDMLNIHFSNITLSLTEELVFFTFFSRKGSLEM